MFLFYFLDLDFFQSHMLFVAYWKNIQPKQSSFVFPCCTRCVNNTSFFRLFFKNRPSSVKSLSLLAVGTGWNRRSLLKTVTCLAAFPVFRIFPVQSANNEEIVLPDGVRFWLVKKGIGKAHPTVGDLVGIRFRAKYGEYVFDDIMKSEQPYYLRIGSHNVIQGIEEVLPMLNVGDVAHVVVPGEAAFGSKGRKASPGKRAIPPNATIEYDLELSELPGKEDFTPQVLDSP